MEENRNSNFIDFRSDTVTLPTEEMRTAMFNAPLGDDVYGEDPTVNKLERIAAELLGKESAVFVPSGTMGNLSAILTHCGRGDELILGNLSHTFLYEAGGVSALGGIHPRTIPNQDDGTLDLKDIEDAIRGDDPHFPTTRLICLENTHNRCGGAVLTPEYTQAVAELAEENDLKVHLDGARIFNAAAALNVPAFELARPVNSVTFCLSKALCAPVGSVLCGTEKFIARARRARKILGGGMRQAGVIAAAGIVALETMVDRLSEDHIKARTLADGIDGLSGLHIEKVLRPSNMVYLKLSSQSGFSVTELVEKLRAEGVLIGVAGKDRLRLVTHYWISEEDIEKTIQVFLMVMER